MVKKILNLGLIICFFLTTLGPYSRAHAGTVLGLPVPGTMINLSSAYEPVIIKGLTVHKDNPFLFDFIVDVGQDRISGEPLKKEGEKLIKYFLASLAIPDKDVWVNLSPYEKNRMIPEALGQTDMGRDLLEQDYILKQITASLIYPEKQLGKAFWDKVYAKAQQSYGKTEVPVNTFNKVWILADRAEVFERNQTAFVVDSHLKVMLEEDYLALQKHNTNVIPAASTVISDYPTVIPAKAGIHSLGSQVIKEIILPQLEKEVNIGKNFANLRQILNSLILANWYKKNLKQALLNQVYTNQSKVKGIDLNDPTVKQQIYEQYLKAYKKGVFNYIKEDVTTQGDSIPRKYFSGGFGQAQAVIDPAVTDNPAELGKAINPDRAMVSLETVFSSNKPLSSDAAMAASEESPLIKQIKRLYIETNGAISPREVYNILGERLTSEQVINLIHNIGVEVGYFGPIHDPSIGEVNELYAKYLGRPGQFPYTRGIHPALAQRLGGRLPIVRRYASFGTAEESNTILKDQLAQGTTGFSVAFDLPTQNGYDSDHPLAKGEVGKVGVAVDTLKDMEDLLEGMPIGQMRTSMTINPTGPILMAMYIAAARKKGVSDDKINGTIQHDVLKEFVARGTYVLPYNATMRLTADVFEWAKDNVPNYNTINFSGYHFREKGASEVQEVAYVLADAIQYISVVKKRGLSKDDLARILSQVAWFKNMKLRTFEEVAKYRALRRIWAVLVKEAFDIDLDTVSDSKLKDIYKKAQTARIQSWAGGSDVRFETKVMDNEIRNAIRAFNVSASGAQGWDGAAFDESEGLPTKFSQGLVIDRFHVVQEEKHLMELDDHMGGSYLLEAETNRIEEAVWQELAKICSMDNFLNVLKNMRNDIQVQANQEQKDIETGKIPVVGVNTNTEGSEFYPKVERLEKADSYDQKQIDRLNAVKASRNQSVVDETLDALERAAHTTENLMPYILKAVEAYATKGEISDRLRRVFGASAQKDPWERTVWTDQSGKRWELPVMTADEQNPEIFDQPIRDFIKAKAASVGHRASTVYEVAKVRGYFVPEDISYVETTSGEEETPGQFPYTRGIGKKKELDSYKDFEGYRLREMGADAVQELSTSLLAAIKYVESNQGEERIEAARRVRLVLSSHDDFYEEVAKFRVARRLWAKLLKDRGITDKEAQQLVIFAWTSESTLTEEKYGLNIHRAALQAYQAYLGGVQGIHVARCDLLFGVTDQTKYTEQMAKDTVPIIEKETGLAGIADPLGGSFILESTTNRLEHLVREEFNHMEDLIEGGVGISGPEAIEQPIGIEQTALVGLEQFLPEARESRLRNYLARSIDNSRRRQLAEYTAGLRQKVGTTKYKAGPNPKPHQAPVRDVPLLDFKGKPTVEGLSSVNQIEREYIVNLWAMQGQRLTQQVKSALGLNNKFNSQSGIIGGLFMTTLTVGEDAFNAIALAWGRQMRGQSFLNLKAANGASLRVIKAKLKTKPVIGLELTSVDKGNVLEMIQGFSSNWQPRIQAPLKILVAKPGLDGHDRGATTMVQILKDAGYEVIYTGLQQTSEKIVATALQENVDVIGLSILSDAHKTYAPQVAQLLEQNGIGNKLVILGGVIPDEDQPELLNENGVGYIYPRGTRTQKITDDLNAWKAWREKKEVITVQDQNSFGMDLPGDISVNVTLRKTERSVLSVPLPQQTVKSEETQLAVPMRVGLLDLSRIPTVDGLWSENPDVRLRTAQHFALAGDLLIEAAKRNPYLSDHILPVSKNVSPRQGHATVASAGIGVTKEHFDLIRKLFGNPPLSDVPQGVGVEEIVIEVPMPDGSIRLLDILRDTEDSERKTIAKFVKDFGGEGIQQVEVWTGRPIKEVANKVVPIAYNPKTKEGDPTSGVFLVDKAPRPGADGTTVMFQRVIVEGGKSVLVEFVNQMQFANAAMVTDIKELPSVKSGELKLEMVDNDIMQITIDRQKTIPVNSISRQLMKDLIEIIHANESNEGVAGTILTGAGQLAFVAGGDLIDVVRMNKEKNLPAAEEFVSLGIQLADTMDRSTKPVVAALNAYTLGAGSHLALAAHARVMARINKDHTGQKIVDNFLQHPEITLKAIPAWGALQRLPRLIGPKQAARVFLEPDESGYPKRLTAEEALDMGYVDKVVMPEDLQEAAIEKVRELQANPLKMRRHWDEIGEKQKEEALNLHNDLEVQEWIRVQTKLGRGAIAQEILRLIQLGYKKNVKEGDRETIVSAARAFISIEAREAIQKQVFSSRRNREYLAQHGINIDDLADRAMRVEENHQPENGGIDLNTSSGMQWKVSKDGKGVEMNVDPAMIERMKHDGINWLSPVIFKMTPVTSVWPLVGLQAPVKEGA